MTFHSDFVQPPRIATSLVSMFAPAEQTEAIVGDLLEEFIQHTHNSGLAFARNWYWHQTVKTISCLTLTAFREAPWVMLVVTIGGIFLHRIVQGLPDKALSAITDKYVWYWSSHFDAYNRLLMGMSIVHLVGSIFVGCVVAFAAKSKEMVATTSLTVVLFAMFAVGYIEWVVVSWPTRDSNLEWSILIWQSLSFLALLIGGAIVRILRLSARNESRPVQHVGI